MEFIRPGDHAVQLNDDLNKSAFADNNEVVLSIRIVVHTTGRWENSAMSNNHVTILLLLSSNRSIQLNMATEEDDSLGVLIWSIRAWQHSNSAIVSKDISLEGRYTVATVYRVLRAPGLHRYQFSGGGSGCRYWV